MKKLQGSPGSTKMRKYIVTFPGGNQTRFVGSSMDKIKEILKSWGKTYSTIKEYQ